METVKSTLKAIGKALFVPVSLPLLILVVLMAASGFVGVRAIRTKPELVGLVKGPSVLKEEEEALIAEVGKLISLPKDENPTIATVTDLEKVKEQTFFKQAQNGDKVIIYTNARRVILYRPSEKRVIEVGAVNINQQAQPVETPEASEEPIATPSPAPES